MKYPPRYAIRRMDTGALFSEMDIVGTIDSIERDAVGTKTVHERHLLAPKFEAHNETDASKFDTQADATEILTNKFLKDHAAFDGCEVVEIS